MEKSNLNNMRVVCIQDDWGFKVGLVTIIYKDGPKKDRIYNVVDQQLINSQVYFTLAEFKSEDKFNSHGFRPVDEQFGADVCERIAKECEQIEMPLTALFIMRLEIHVDSIKHLKKLTNGLD